MAKTRSEKKPLTVPPMKNPAVTPLTGLSPTSTVNKSVTANAESLTKPLSLPAAVNPAINALTVPIPVTPSVSKLAAITSGSKKSAEKLTTSDNLSITENKKLQQLTNKTVTPATAKMSVESKLSPIAKSFAPSTPLPKARKDWSATEASVEHAMPEVKSYSILTVGAL